MNLKNFFYTISICALTIFNSGCASDVPRMQKYDSQASYKPETAIIVVNTSNVTFVDINKFTPASFKQDQEFYNKTTSKTSIKGPLTQTPVQNRYEQQKSASEYQDGFDLRRLFGKKKPNQTQAASVDVISPEPTPVEESSDRTNVWRLFKPTISLATPFNYSKAVYTVEPGIYYIAFAYAETNAVPSYTRDPGVTQHGEVMYGAFEVKPGAVVYLGDLDFNWITMNKNKQVNIINNISAVKNDLRANGKNNLAEKLEVANFYPRGSKIVISQQGDAQIISN